MNILIISYNIKEPFACLIQDKEIVKYLKESEYYHIDNPYKSFPESAIEQIMVNTEKIDKVVFLGKQLLFLKDLIIQHSFLFPRTFTKFAEDLSDCFKTTMHIQKTIKKIKDENQLRTKIGLDVIYYLKMDEALAHSVSKDSIVITCLTDVFEGDSFYCFTKEGDDFLMDSELNIKNSFSRLLEIYHEAGGEICLEKIIDYSDRGDFEFKKSYLTIKNNSFALRGLKKGIENFKESNEEILLKIFSNLIAKFQKDNKQIVFISDAEIPNRIIQAHPEIEFKTVNDNDKIESIKHYLNKKIAA